MNFANKRPILPLFLCCLASTILLFAGCAGPQKTTTTRVIPTIDTSATRIGMLRSWLINCSIAAHSLSAAGDITLDQNGESNSASFTLKSKRLDDFGQTRIDSLSVEVAGPFGIKVARFLASPDRYQFYDILHGQTLAGRTDAYSLEELTHLNGISLSMMSDLAFGLAPGGDKFAPEDSLILFSNGSHHTLLIQRAKQNATEALDLEGSIPNEGTVTGLMLVQYRRWNSIAIDPIHTSERPIATIQYAEPTIVNGVSIPQHIEATAGLNQLVLQYNTIQVNPSPLTVRIKMP